MTNVLGNIPGTDIYECVNSCEEAREFEGIKIIRYESSVYYANSENFVYKIIKLSQIDPYEVLTKINKKKSEHLKITKKMKEIVSFRYNNTLSLLIYNFLFQSEQNKT